MPNTTAQVLNKEYKYTVNGVRLQANIASAMLTCTAFYYKYMKKELKDLKALKRLKGLKERKTPDEN